MTVGSITASSSVSGRLFRGGTAKRYDYNACITISWATRRWAPASLVAQDDKVRVASRHLLSIQPVTHPVQYDGAPGREQRNPQTADDGAWLRPNGCAWPLGWRRRTGAHWPITPDSCSFRGAPSRHHFGEINRDRGAPRFDDASIRQAQDTLIATKRLRRCGAYGSEECMNAAATSDCNASPVLELCEKVILRRGR